MVKLRKMIYTDHVEICIWEKDATDSAHVDISIERAGIEFKTRISLAELKDLMEKITFLNP